MNMNISDQKNDRVKELIDENEQLRKRLSVYRNTENQQANSIEFISMLKDNHLKLEKTNEELSTEIEKMKLEKEYMNKHWEKQVVELT